MRYLAVAATNRGRNLGGDGTANFSISYGAGSFRGSTVRLTQNRRRAWDPAAASYAS